MSRRPPEGRDQASSSVDSPLFKSISRQKLLSALRYGWGGSRTGAIDPQPFWKYMRPLFICAVANREPAVVSIQ